MFSTRMSKVAPSLTSIVALVFPPTRISVAWRTYTDKNFSINISIIYLFIYFHLLLVKELPCWTSGHTENNLLKRRIASKWGKVCDDGNPEITLVKVTTLPFLSRFFRFSFQFIHLLSTTRLSCNQKEQISKQRVIMWPKWQNVCRKFQVHLTRIFKGMHYAEIVNQQLLYYIPGSQTQFLCPVVQGFLGLLQDHWQV